MSRFGVEVVSVKESNCILLFFLILIEDPPKSAPRGPWQYDVRTRFQSQLQLNLSGHLKVLEVYED